MPDSSDERKPTSWTARVLAPVLLIVVAAAIVLIVSGSLSGNDDGSSSEDHKRSSNSNCPGASEEAIKNGYYVVEEGDNFTTIAEKTCISEQRLQELNPNLDPFGLQVQNCVDLVPDGCKKLASG